MKPLDRQALLASLKDRANHRSHYAALVYLGLATRIARGEFDVEEDR